MKAKTIKLKEGNNMKKVLLRIPLFERIVLISALVAAFTNQLTSPWFMESFDSAWFWLSKKSGSYTTLWLAIVVVLYITSKIYQSSRINIPAKNSTTKKLGKFIE